MKKGIIDIGGQKNVIIISSIGFRVWNKDSSGNSHTDSREGNHWLYNEVLK